MRLALLALPPFLKVDLSGFRQRLRAHQRLVAHTDLEPRFILVDQQIDVALLGLTL